MPFRPLQPANNLFLGGYLNARGAEAQKLYQMLTDAGYTIDADAELEDVFANLKAKAAATPDQPTQYTQLTTPTIKTTAELRLACAGASE